jgi:transposase InsO family protein
VRFALIDAERAHPMPVATVSEMCRTLGVSRAGYYAWKRRGPSQRAQADVALAAKVLEVHEKSRRTYGRPRIHDKLKKQGVRVSGKRLARVMCEQGVRGKTKKRFVVTTDSDHPLEVAPNVLDRDFRANGPNQRWVGDITYLFTPEGWVYLAVVIDLYSRMVVGWSVGTVIDRFLVLRALEQAKQRRGVVAGGLFHSDRGSQYASEDYRNALIAAGLTCSMSRTGDCFDNAVSESFFATLKRELGENFKDLADAQRQLFDYIESFYNGERSHSTLGYSSPLEFERNARLSA